jgi:surface antigen
MRHVMRSAAVIACLASLSGVQVIKAAGARPEIGPGWNPVVTQVVPGAGPPGKPLGEGTALRPTKGLDLPSLKAELTDDDSLAVLEALGYALEEVPDGSTYAWHRDVGPLWGTVRIASSFRDDEGSICRHLVLMLSLNEFTRAIEAVACRDSAKHWIIGG